MVVPLAARPRPAGAPVIVRLASASFVATVNVPDAIVTVAPIRFPEVLEATTSMLRRAACRRARTASRVSVAVYATSTYSVCATVCTPLEVCEVALVAESMPNRCANVPDTSATVKVSVFTEAPGAKVIDIAPAVVAPKSTVGGMPPSPVPPTAGHW